VSTWIAQLAALRTLEQTVQQGYATVKDGLDHIGDVRYTEYQLHSQYYGSLSTVNPAVETDAKTAELVELLSQLVRRLQASLAYWQKQHPVTQP
jgi:hypothetical protein